MIIKDKVFNGEVKVNYLFKRSATQNNKLVIVFSAFPTKNSKPRYNYMNTIEGLDTNKLFILDDFGCRASYYLCENRDYKIERSVKALIDYIVDQYKIDHIISAGSSKGGYAALYYGIKYGFNEVIAASPQYFVGDYVNKFATEVAAFMAGGTKEEDVKYLNDILPNTIINTPHSPTIFIHVGSGESHYKLHVKPMVELLKQKGIKCNLDLGDYSKHSDVSLYYPEYLRRNVCSSLDLPFINKLQFNQQECKLGHQVTFTIDKFKGTNSFAWYVYKDKDAIHKQMYKEDNSFNYEFKEKGNYKVKVFAINPKKVKTTITTKNIEIK